MIGDRRLPHYYNPYRFRKSKYFEWVICPQFLKNNSWKRLEIWDIILTNFVASAVTSVVKIARPPRKTLSLQMSISCRKNCWK